MQLSGTVHYSSEGKRGIVILGLFDLAKILSLFEKRSFLGIFGQKA